MDDGREAPRRQVEAMLRLATRPFEIDGKMIQVGAFAGMAVRTGRRRFECPTCFAARTSRSTMRRAAA